MVTTFSERHDFPVLGEEDKPIILNILGEKRFSLTCTLIHMLHGIRYSPLGVYSNLEPGPQRTKATRVYTWVTKLTWSQRHLDQVFFPVFPGEKIPKKRVYVFPLLDPPKEELSFPAGRTDPPSAQHQCCQVCSLVLEPHCPGVNLHSIIYCPSGQAFKSLRASFS